MDKLARSFSSGTSASAPVYARGILAAVLALFLAAGGLAGCSGSTGTPQEHIAKAKQYQKEGKYNASIIELKNALQQNPKLAEARWLLGQAYLAQRNGAAAEPELERAQKLGYKDPELPIAQIRALLDQNEFQKALDKAKTAPDDTPKAALLAVQAEAELGLNNVQKGKDLLHQALNIDPKSLEARLVLARVSIASGDLDEAEKDIGILSKQAPSDWRVQMVKGDFAMSRKKPAEALAAYKEALKLNHNNPYAQIGAARALLTQKKPDEALKYIKPIAHGNPNSPVANLLKGFAYYEKDDYSSARDSLQKVLAASPNQMQALLLLANVQYKLGQMEQAASLLRKFTAAAPGYIPALKLKAAVELRLHQPEKAAQTLDPIMKQGKPDAQVLAMLGSAEMEMGNYSKGTGYLEKAVSLAPDAASVRTMLALSHMAAGSTHQAVSELETAVKLDPKMIRADILLVLAQLKQKHFDDAIKSATELTKKYPKNPLPQNLIGAAEIGKGDISAGRAAFEKALNIEPKFTPALMNLASLDLSQGKKDDARKRYEQVVKIQPQNLRALLSLAKLDFDAGKTSDGVNRLKQAQNANDKALAPRILLARYYLRTQDVNDAQSVVQEALNIAPNNPVVLELQGQVQQASGNAQGSVDTYKQLVKAAPKAPQAYVLLADAQANAGQLDDAHASYDKALKLKSDYVPAILGLGSLELVQKQYDPALKLARQAAKAAPKAPNGFALEGDILLAQGKAKDAVTAYQQALDKAQSSVLVAKLHQAQMAAGERQAAMKTVDDWLAQHPKDDVVRFALANTYQHEKESGKAIQEYEEILKDKPDNVAALNNLAWLYYEKKDSRAADLAKKAYGILPDRPEVADTYGWILVNQGQVQQGTTILEKAAAKAPNAPDIAYHLAVGWAKSGQKDKAKQALKELLAKHAHFSERSAAEKYLKELD